MDNRAVAAVLTEIADLLDIKGGDPYRSRAFRQMSRVVESLAQPLDALIASGGLEKLPGLGPGAARRIKEILRTGTCADLERLRAVIPAGLRELVKVEGLGPRHARLVYQHLRITSIDQLEQACRAGRVAGLPGIGAQTEEKLLRAIERARQPVDRLLLPRALEQGEAMARAIREVPGVLAAEVTGSARRRKETVQDLDLCVAADDRHAVASRFVGLSGVTEILVSGDGRASVKLQGGQQADLRVVPEESFGAALHYFTGSQLHNVYLRARANRQGLKVSDHGIFWRRDERRLSPGRTEAEIFASVGLPYIPPELRENLGELEAAERGALPQLAELPSLRGDARVQPRGAREVGSFARAAKERGYAWLLVQAPPRARGWRAALRRVEEAEGIRLLSLVAAPIGGDGSLRADPAALAEADWVTGIPDPGPSGTWPTTAALLSAMRSGHLTSLAHPSGRVLPSDKRAPVEVDALLLEARRCGMSLELDADPSRLDLHSAGCKQARELGVRIALASTAQTPEDLGRIRFGLDQARRGWLEEVNLVNALDADSVLDLRRGHGPSIGPKAPRPPPDGRDDRELATGLGKRPLGSGLRARLERYFRGEPDAALEAALRTLGPNALQTTFQILSESDGALPPSGRLK